MKQRARLLGLIGLIVTGLFIAAVSAVTRSPDASAAPGTTVRLSPASQNVEVGDIVTVDVAIDDVTRLAAFEFRTKYNTKVLKFEDVTETDFLGSTGRQVVCPPPTGAGETDDILFGCATMKAGGAQPVDGSGVLAHISFSAIKPGLTYLTFTKLDLSDDMSEDIPASRNEAAVRVVGSGESTAEALPATPTLDPLALTPAPIAAAPTPSTWLTPEPGATPMSRLVESVRRSGTADDGSGGSQSGSSNSPRAGEGPGEGSPVWWPPLLAGLLAAAGASLLPVSLYLRTASIRRRS